MNTPHTPRARAEVFLALSVDGYIARQDGSVDWLSVVEQPGEDYGYAAFFSTIDVLLIGRNSWDMLLGFDRWFYGDKRIVVMTHRPLGALPAGADPARIGTASGDLLPLLQQLAGEGVQRVYLDGGELVRQGLREGCVDSLTLSWIPVLLGSGRRLFADADGDAGNGIGARLQLQDQRHWPSGLLQARYQVHTGENAATGPGNAPVGNTRPQQP